MSAVCYSMGCNITFSELKEYARNVKLGKYVSGVEFDNVLSRVRVATSHPRMNITVFCKSGGHANLVALGGRDVDQVCVYMHTITHGSECYTHR